MNASPARFITFEGGEGTGKSTQAKRLVDELKKRRIPVILTREPGGSKGAEDVRALLVQGEPGRWDPLTELLLVFAARVDHVKNLIRPALDAGKWVICDRFIDSTYAYQGAGRGLDRKQIREIETIAIGDLKPDLTFIMDLPIDVGLRRARSRGLIIRSETRFEKFDDAFHGRLRAEFLKIASQNKKRCALISAVGREDEIAKILWGKLSERFGL
ncbi:MAG TPA: dTMP kinase [Rhizomicrobium sp.]|jgi:dTMP kinase|nr:dTMP kinase [Rhizomicrobium sp.]